MEIGRENVKNIRVMDDVIKKDKTEYFSHTLNEIVDGENSNDCILVTISRICK